MKLITLPTDQIGKYVADQIITLINQKPDAVLGLATGSTPIPVYYELVTAYDRHEVSFADVKTFNLDEYCGLEPSDPHSYHYFYGQIPVQSRGHQA